MKGWIVDVSGGQHISVALVRIEKYGKNQIHSCILDCHESYNNSGYSQNRLTFALRGVVETCFPYSIQTYDRMATLLYCLIIVVRRDVSNEIIRYVLTQGLIFMSVIMAEKGECRVVRIQEFCRDYFAKYGMTRFCHQSFFSDLSCELIRSRLLRCDVRLRRPALSI